MQTDMRKLYFILLALSFMSWEVLSQSLSQRLISVELNNVTTIQALDQINQLDSIKLSYNPDDILQNERVSKSYQQEEVSTVLSDVLGKDYELKYRGSYIIIKKKAQLNEKKTFVFSGEITDAETGESVKDVTVYEVSNLDATLSDDRGNFELTVSSKTDYVTFAISQEHYFDTLIQVKDVAELQEKVKLRRKKDTTLTQKIGIETKRLVKLFTDRQSRENARNVSLEEVRPFQFSLVPMIGTNGKISGQVVNKYSVNLLAGYSKGTTALELGGLYNIDRENVSGVQLAGFGNAVGDSTRGVQLAGFVNTNRGYTSGVQAAGFVNVVGDDLSGFQGAGFVNVAGEISGAQMAGFVNVAYHDVKGGQLSGFANYGKDFKGFQGSGFFNYTTSLQGMQLSAGMNLTKYAKGMQAATMNVADTLYKGMHLGVLNVVEKKANGYQMGLINVSKEIKGMQSALLNVTGQLNGLQFGLINIADSLDKGAVIGLLNFVRNGKVEFGMEYNEAMEVNLAFRSGTRAFYTVLNASKQVTREELWSYGGGFGTQFRLFNNFYSNIEIVSNMVHPKDEHINTLNLLNRFNLNFAYQVGKHCSFNAGPALNIYITQVQNPDTGVFGNDFGQSPFYDRVKDSTSFQMWFGYAASIRF